MRRHNVEVALPGRATLTFFTDGLVERRDSDIDLGIKRLVATVAQRAIVDDADALCAEIMLEMHQPDEQPVDDDCTLLVSRRGA